MVFSSLIFLFLFLPVFLGLYYLCPLRWRSIVIFIGSCIFYAWWRVDFLLLITAIALWNYYLAKLIKTRPISAKKWLTIGVAGNLLTLGIFKYFNFGIENLNAALSASGLNTIDALRFILPIGISFHIFQSISFLVDTYRKDAEPPKRAIDFLAFMTLFPQLIAGPVLRYKDLADQFTSRTHSWDKFSLGAQRFMTGFIKKVLIADSIAPLADASFALQEPSMADAWLGALAYTAQLYFDFSGYSDMAIGLGMMMGFRFIENFNAPYISRSITEFWRRWHISLSTWLRDYLYIPLGGNRKGKTRTYTNLMTTMVLGGLWHGANWTFILWGLWHGSLMAIERAFGLNDKSHKAKSAIKNLYTLPLTFTLVVFGWVLFRAPDLSHALTFYTAMLIPSNTGISDAFAWQLTGISITMMITGYTLIFTAPLIENRYNFIFREVRATAWQVVVIFAFLLSVIKLSAESYSPFLYFQF